MSNWVEEEQQKIQQEKETKLREQGKLPYHKLNKGENKLEIANKKPEERISNFNQEVHVFELVEPQGYCLQVSKYLYNLILAHVQKTGSFKMNILKTGDQTKTRYEVLEWN